MSLLNKRPIRIPQLIGVFGPGAMVNFPGDETLIVADLEFWDFGTAANDHIVTDDRLRARLAVDELRRPPEFGGDDRKSVPAFRFPAWHYCRRCGEMARVPPGRLGATPCRGRGEPCNSLPEQRRDLLIPVRFVTICQQGHLDDFPFRRWAHGGDPCQTDARLEYSVSGRSASLSGIFIRCIDCGKSRSLSGSFGSDTEAGGPLASIGVTCRGHQPWRGRETSSCNEPLKVVQRGASNVYFPVTTSSIHLPVWADQTPDLVAAVVEHPPTWRILSSGHIDGEPDGDRIAMIADMKGVDPDALARACRRKLQGNAGPAAAPVSEEEYRAAEYRAFMELEGSAGADLHVERMEGTLYGPPVNGLISEVSFVNKLRETRALSGFTRLLPPSGPDDDRIVRLDSGPDRSWLPVAVVRGEGLFLRLRQSVVDPWLNRPEVQERFNDYASGLSGRMADRAGELSPKFMMLHSFAHLLIKQVSLDCGYGTASLRERIYCDSGDGGFRMEGILIYTSSGDSEGSLGGLVRQGLPGRLEPILSEAIRKAEWCSSDPICIESRGQGADSSNLAACHACALLPETSCEMGNRVLDRAFLVGTPGARSIGLFG